MFTGIYDERLFPIGLGTYGLVGVQAGPLSSGDKHLEAVKYAISSGINVIDTAEMYGEGRTEELVGRAISSFRRDDIFIISKVWPSNLERKKLFSSAEASLKRLGTNYIDLYLIHWPSQTVPLDESINAMLELRDRGVIREIGVSNFDNGLLDQALDYAGRGKIVANEIELNFSNFARSRETLEHCRSKGVRVIAYSPLSRGRISHNSGVQQIAQKYGATSVQVILRFLMEFSLPIPKSSNPEHIDEIVGAARVPLTEEVVDLLTHKF